MHEKALFIIQVSHFTTTFNFTKKWFVTSWSDLLNAGIKSHFHLATSEASVLASEHRRHPVLRHHTWGRWKKQDTNICELFFLLIQFPFLFSACWFIFNDYVVGFHFLLQRIFPTQGSNPDLPHCGQTLYCLSHQGSP